VRILNLALLQKINDTHTYIYSLIKYSSREHAVVVVLEVFKHLMQQSAMECNECNITSIEILDARKGTKSKYYELTKYDRDDKVSKHLIEVI